MEFTIRVRKVHIAAFILVAALAGTTTALAANPFTDVTDGKFYSEAVEWAFESGITTGTSATTFEPDATVTRGENITFAKRYHDNLVTPALDAIEADLVDNAAAIADVEATAEATASDLATHATHSTTYWLVVGPGGAIYQSTYPGATATEFDTGIYHIDLPGLEVYDWDTGLLVCNLQSNAITDVIRITGVLLNDDLPHDEFQVITWAVDLDGTPVDSYVAVQLTC